MAPTLYLDEVSPPVRSVLLTIEALGIKVEQVHIDLLKEEQLSEEFIKVWHVFIIFLRNNNLVFSSVN